METLEQIKSRIEAAVSGVQLQIILNDSPSAQTSLLVDRAHGLSVARWLKEDVALKLDFASNVTGVDWPERVEKIKNKVKKVVDGVEKEVEEITEKRTPAYLEVVYHLYSMEKKHGPVILRLRTGDRANDVQAKVREWLGYGVRVVWVVYPVTREVQVFRPGAAAEVYTGDMVLTCEELIPGFASPVSRFFARSGA